MSDRLARARVASRRAIIPPQRERLSTWAERSIILPAEVADTTGPMKLWPFQHGIADAMTDPEIERVTFLKPTRVGFTTLLTSIIAHYVVNDPAPILVYQPTDDEARGYMVDDIEPIFDASPALAGKLTGEEDEHGRNILTERRFAGGSLKVRGAKSPKNFRRLNARVLLMDEVDGMEPTPEGSPIDLASKRTDSFRERKIIIGSTPVRTATSYVLTSYAASDKRLYQVPCPSCGTFFEMLWEHFQWPPAMPDAAAIRCPHCEELIEEHNKAAMVRAGDWFVTRPEVKGHAGFRMNAFISLLPNTTWAHLAREWEEKKGDPATKQVFVNTRLAQGWEDEGEALDATDLEGSAEAFGLPDRDVVAAPGAHGPDTRAMLPPDCLLMTVGVDVQKDRLEVVFLGWGRPRTFGRFELPQLFVLGHRVIWGQPQDDTVWHDLETLLTTRWRHPLGGEIKASATAVDSGFETDTVYDYCFPRHGRRIVPVKGQSGFGRPFLSASSSTRRRGQGAGQKGRIYIAGVDAIKRRLVSFLGIRGVVRFSRSLVVDSPNWFEQLASERCVLRYIKGQPVERWERSQNAPAEALDCMVYAIAARELLTPDWDSLHRQVSRPTTERQHKSLSDFAGMHNR